MIFEYKIIKNYDYNMIDNDNIICNITIILQQIFVEYHNSSYKFEC